MNILVVDNDRATLIALQRLLRSLGNSVTCAMSASAAIAELDDHSDFDAVLTDYHMIGLNGIDLIRRIRLTNKSMRICLLSGEMTAEIKEAALLAGADAVLSKPVDQAELREALGF